LDRPAPHRHRRKAGRFRVCEAGVGIRLDRGRPARSSLRGAGETPALPRENLMPLPPYDASVLPAGIRSRFVERVSGLRVHTLEAGDKDRPLLLLLHGFPEIAYSWRKVMPALAEAGYHVVAPDQRGYGRTEGWSANFDDDLAPFRLLNAVRDAAGLVAALG